MDGNIKDDVYSSNKKFSIGSIVWGKLGSYKWWPAIIINSVDGGLPDAKFGSLWIFWFGDHKVSQLPRKRIAVFASSFSHMYCENSGKNFHSAVNEALEVLAKRFDYKYASPTDLLLWARAGFKPSGENHTLNNNLPALVLKHLDHIKNLNKARSGCEEDCIYSTVAAEEMLLSNASFKGVKEGSLKLEAVCISCFGNELEIVASHPLFEGGLCLQCKERVQETIFAFGNDGKNICCVICAKPGSLILCDNINCPRSYCFDCIVLLLGPEAHQQILQTSPWYCFFCVNPSNNNGLLQIKCDWERRIKFLFQPSEPLEDEISTLNCKTKETIKVLSLFDGISTGKLALDSLGIAIDKYYASEIDEDAINVSKFHHLESIIRIGDITQLTEEKIESICPIDLVIGGSPCNELSLVNPVRKGLYDFSGTGPLFFDYFHVLKTVERFNGKRRLFFLFENVAAMRQKDKSVITSFLMKEPVIIDAKFVSPQSRARYFWGNIPGMHLSQNYCAVPHDDSLNDGYESDKLLSHCLLEGFERKAMVEKIRTVTTQRNSLTQGNLNLFPVEMNGEPDILWVTELEKIFGFPLHYTDTGYLGISKRRELLGRSWSVPVIINIFRPLLSMFMKKNS